MAARGRPPKPHALKVIEGNRGHRPLVDNAPKPTKRAPKPPQVFAKGAKKAWDRIIAAMPDEFFTQADENTLAALADAIHYRNLAAEQLIGAPLIVLGGNGNPTPNPLFKIVESQTRLIHSLGSVLGLDPVSRQRLIAPGAAEDGDNFGIE